MALRPGHLWGVWQVVVMRLEASSTEWPALTFEDLGLEIRSYLGDGQSQMQTCRPAASISHHESISHMPHSILVGKEATFRV